MATGGLFGLSVIMFFSILAAEPMYSRRQRPAKDDICTRLMTRYRKRCGEDDLARNITALWDHVKTLSRPVNVYVNGKQFAEIGQHPTKHSGHSENSAHIGHSEVIPPSPHNHHDHHDSCAGYLFAKCHMKANTASQSKHDVKGTIYFRQKPGHGLEAKVDLAGFDTSKHKGDNFKQLHAIHLHEFGDLSKGCNSFGGHFNPFGVTHGGPGSHGHVGDWGNLSVDRTGRVNTSLSVGQSSLFGRNSIAGRGLVIHEGMDDLGTGHSHSSKSSGNAGGRIACCPVIHHKGSCEMWHK